MNLTKDDIAKSSKQIGLTDSQAESLWLALQSVVLIYIGLLITFLSMTWFYSPNLSITKSLLISIIYALIFFGSGAYFWFSKKLRVPRGLLSSLGIVMVPLIVYSLQNVMRWWPTQSSNEYPAFYHWIKALLRNSSHKPEAPFPQLLSAA